MDIPHDRGLEENSDADAVLGALGLNDIGFYFPPDDESIKGIYSLDILRKVRELAEENSAVIHNIDSIVVAEEPEILPHVEAMKLSMSKALDIDHTQVGVKANTNELMGFVGRGEGIAAMAVASIEIRD